MSNNKTLFLHCKSKDDDLGIHNLAIGADFEWSFKLHIFGKTLFWCYMTSNNGHAAFEMYYEDDNFFYRCNWKNCFWIAKDDGIYLRNLLENYDEFNHKWEPGWWWYWNGIVICLCNKTIFFIVFVKICRQYIDVIMLSSEFKLLKTQ